MGNQNTIHRHNPRTEYVVGILLANTSVHADGPGPRKSRRVLLTGLAAYTVRENGVLQGGSGAGTGQTVQLADPGRTRYTGTGVGGPEFGVMVPKVGPIRVFPLVGAGGAGTGVGGQRRSPHESPRVGQQMRFERWSGGGGLHATVGVGVEFRIGQRFGLVFGLRLGYLALVLRSRSIEGVPGGFFARIMIGVFYRTRSGD